MNHFAHALVITEEEFTDCFDNETPAWNILTSTDYMVHCLFDVTAEKLIYLNDNIHCNIEENINSFLEGFKYANGEFNSFVEKIIVVVPNYCYDKKEVEQAIKEYYGF